MKSIKKHIDSSFAVFIIIAIGYAAGNFIWWQMNTPVIPLGVQAFHLTTVFLDQNLFTNAPLLTWIMRFMFFIFGTENFDLTIIFVNYIFFLAALYFIYKIGLELKDKQAGNIAMILFAVVPAVYGMSRQYGHQDYHIIAGITFNIFCLIKTDYFKNRKWSVIYGISAGLGLLIKDPFLAYFFVPFAYSAIYGLIREEKLKRKILINTALSVVIGSLTAGCHYFRLEIIRKLWFDNHSQKVSLLEFENIRAITTGLWEQLLSPAVFIIFFIGLVWFMIKYKGKYKNIMMLWFFVPWLGILFMGHYKIASYGLGFVPAAVLIGSVWLSQINKKFIKFSIILAVCVTGVLQYVDFSYGKNIKIFDLKTNIKGHDIRYYDRNNEMIKLQRDQIDTIMELTEFLKNKYPQYTIGLSDLLEYPDYDAMMLQMNLHGINFVYMRYYDDLLEKGLDSKKFVDLMSKADVLLYPDMTKEQILEFNYKRMEFFPFFYKNITKQRQIDSLNEVFKMQQDIFYQADIFEIKDKTNIIIMVKKNKINDKITQTQN